LYYQQFQPHPILKPFVQCYWIISSQARNLSAPEHGVIPGGYVDLIFNLGDRIYLSDSGKLFTDKAKGVVAGPFDHFQRFRAEGQLEFFGVRFHLGKAPFFSPALPLGEARNQAIPLDLLCTDKDVKADLQGLGLHLTRRSEITRRMADIEAFLIRFKERWKEPDMVVARAVGIIESSKGQLSVDALASALHISARQLERKFTEHIGLSPKAFSRLMRFHQVKSLIENTPEPSGCDLAYTCGYYDQTHLIHEFRKFTGQTPVRYASIQPVGFFLYDHQANC
jgi:AraC-like DNA-binding protein